MYSGPFFMLSGACGWLLMGASPGLRCRVPLVEEEPYTLPEAARILRLSRRRVIQMLAAGELEGSQDPETGRWAIP